jgi:hypothetical protein
MSQSSSGGSNFIELGGFGMIIDSNTSYYVTDQTNIIFLLNENYEYITKNTFSNPVSIVTVNSSLYITGYKYVWKADKYLNILITHSESADYRDIYFNCTENLIYIASKGYIYFQVFDFQV